VDPGAGLDRFGKSRRHRGWLPCDRPARRESLYRLSCHGPHFRHDKKAKCNAVVTYFIHGGTNVNCRTAPWLKRLFTGLSSRRPGINPSGVDVRFVALAQGFLRVLPF
jgi:hypothetical protein